MLYAKWLLLAVLLLVPAGSALQISEVMYNPPGSDAGREWVEIHNDGQEVNITGWKLATDGSNHILNVPPENGGSGSMIIESGTYFVIAQDAVKFLAEYPDYSGTLIDSSWTGLTNSEPKRIELKNSSAVVAAIMYSIVNEGSTWCQLGECLPTPGKLNVMKAPEAPEPSPQPENDQNVNEPVNAYSPPSNTSIIVKNNTNITNVEIVSYPKTVFIGALFEINISVNSSRHELYSYVYKDRTPVSLGYNGEKWLGSWDANKVEIYNVSTVSLRNIIENGTKPGNYTLRVKLDGNDISRLIELLEVPFLKINKTKNVAFIYTNCEDCRILIIGSDIAEATRNSTINLPGTYNIALMKGHAIVATEKLVLSKPVEKKPLPTRVAILVLALPRLRLF